MTEPSISDRERPDGERPDRRTRIAVPQSFRDMPRWWTDGTAWLDALPDAIAARCDEWGLRVDGDARHGSNAIAVPVRRAGEPLLLRMTVPGDEFESEVNALRFWDGRGTVLLHAAHPADGSMLLERLALDGTLSDLPLSSAVPILGRLMRRLAVPAPHDSGTPDAVPSTGRLVIERMAVLESEWHRLGRPFRRATLNRVLDLAGSLSSPVEDLAVNGDLHFDQVLRGTREPWLAVDAVLLRGDIEYDLARILWSRIDEMPDAASILSHLGTLVSEAELDPVRAREWVLYRAVDYWLWALGAQLTIDPERCRRLVTAVLAEEA